MTECEKDLNDLKEQIFEDGDTLVSKRALLKRFCEIDKEYNGEPWNLLQILANIDVLIGEEPCEDAVSRDVIRLKIAGLPRYTDGKKIASIRHLKDFLEKELEAPIEVTQDMCVGFTMALESIRRYVNELPPVKPTHKKDKWIFSKTVFDKHGCTVECSSCHKKWKTYDEIRWRKENKFCPNCGAEMESEEE